MPFPVLVLSPKVWAGVFAALLVSGWAGGAAGFCRQRTCSDRTERVCDSFVDPNDCKAVETVCARDAEGCISEGAPLARSSPCLSFAVARGNAQGFGLHDTEIVPIIEQAFARFLEVDCGGGQRPGFSVESAGLVTASSPYYCAEPSLNMSTWFLVKPWKRDPSLLGYTVTTFGRESGEVFDADVEIHVDKIFADFPGQDRRQILLAIATHEAGHFLGLAHSPNPSAIMYEGYSQNGLIGRKLTEDDVAGICAIFPPTSAPLTCGTPGVSQAALEANACEKAREQAALSREEQPEAESDAEGASAAGCAVARKLGRGRGIVLELGVLAALLLLPLRKRRVPRVIEARSSLRLR